MWGNSRCKEPGIGLNLVRNSEEVSLAVMPRAGVDWRGMCWRGGWTTQGIGGRDLKFRFYSKSSGVPLKVSERRVT